MATIAEIKAQYPDLGDLNDDQVVDALHQAFYQDMPRDQVASALGIKPIAAPAKMPERSWLGLANDSAINMANSAVGLVKSGVDLVAPDSVVSGAMSDFIKSGKDKQSDKQKFLDAQLADKLKQDAENDGSTSGQVMSQLKQAGTYIGHGLTSDPGKLVSETAGNLAPFLGVGKAMQAAKLGTGARTAVSGGLSGGLSAGEVRGNIWDKISGTPDADLMQQSPEYAQLRQAGVSELDAKREIGANIMRNLPEIAAVGAVGAATGKYGVEGMASGVFPKMGRVSAGVVGGIDEGVVQGGTEQLASNYGVQRAMPSQSLTEGLGLNMAAEGMPGVAMGVASGGSHAPAPFNADQPPSQPLEQVPPGAPTLQIGNTPDPLISFPDGTVARRSEIDKYVSGLPPDQQPAMRARLMGLAPQPSPADQLRATKVPESGPMTVAVNAGIESQAQDIESGKAPVIDLAMAQEADQAAYEQAMAQEQEQANQQDSIDKPVTSGAIAEAQMSEEDKRAILFSNQPVLDGGAKFKGTQDGDVLNGLGEPFKTKFAAVRRANMEGKDWTISAVEGGWVARRKDAVVDAGEASQPAANQAIQDVVTEPQAYQVEATNAPQINNQPVQANEQNPAPPAPAEAQATPDQAGTTAREPDTAVVGVPAASGVDAVEGGGVAAPQVAEDASQTPVSSTNQGERNGNESTQASQAAETLLKPAQDSQPTESKDVTQAPEAVQEKPQAPASKAAAKPKKLTPNQRIAESLKARADYFAPGNIVKGYSGYDRVISYKPPSGNGDGWSVTVQSVVKQDGRWVIDPKDKRDRTHSTHPDKQALASGPVERVAAEQVGPIETTHNGTRLYKTKVKLGGEVVEKWAVESRSNKRKTAAGERAIGGDSLHDTLDDAKKAADFEAKQDEQAQARKAEINAQEKEAQAKKDANKGKSIVERRKDAILDGATKLPVQAWLGNGTKRDSMQKAVNQERAIVMKMVDDPAAKKRDNEAIDLVRAKGFILGLSNENLPVVKAGLEAQARLKANDYKKPSYRVYSGRDTNSSFYEITKTEYDYAQEVKLKQAEASIRETITPADDTNIGANVDGNQLYQRKDGSIYQMRNGKPSFSGFLEPISVSEPPVSKTETTAKAEQPITPDAAANMQRGDIVRDSKGVEYYAWSARFGRLDVVPLKDGKPVVHAGSSIRFALDQATRDANPEYRTDDLFLVSKAEQPVQPASKFASHDAIAREYGYAVGSDGGIALATGKESGLKVVLKGKRFQVRSKTTDDIVYSGATTDSMGKFLESFWGAEKTAKAQLAAQEPIKAGDTIKHTDGQTYTVVDVYGNTVDAERTVESAGGVTRKAGISLNAAEAMAAKKAAQEPVKPAGKIEDSGEVQTKETDKGVAMFSRGTSATGLPRAQVSSIVNAIRSQWENAPDIIVASSMADPAIPQAVRDYDQLQKSQGAEGEPEGFIYRGKVYLIADQLPTSKDVIRVLFHEALGHKGLRGAYGDGLKPILQQMATMRRKEVSAKANQYGLDMSKESDRLAAAEEVLAEMAQTRPEIGFVTRAVSLIRAWLRKHVPGFSNLALTDNDIIAQFLIPARRFIEGRGAEKQQGAAGQLAFSRGTNEAITNNDVVGNQGGRSADDSAPGAVPHPFSGFTREQFLGNPKITPDSNAKDLVPQTYRSLESVDAVPFLAGNDMTAKYSDLSASVYNAKGQVIATYSSGDTLVVDKKYRRQGIGSELVYQWRMQNPNSKTAATRTKKSQALQEKVWDRIRSERALHEARAYQNESTAPDSGGAMFSRTVGRNSWDAPEPSRFDDLVYKMQDKQIDTKRVVESIKEASGALADEKNVYLQEELFHGRVAARTDDFVNKELSPLVNMMRMRGIDIQELDEYLHARHAEEANKLIAERNPEIPDGGSGMTTQAARDYLAKLAPTEKTKLEFVAAKVDAILAATRQLYADYDLESQSKVDDWGVMFKHYVPLMREDKDGGMGIGQGFSIKGKEVKGRTGSTRKVVDILANIALQRERAIVRGEKNRVATALVGLVKENLNKDFWHVGPPPAQKVYDPASNSVVERADPLYKSRENVLVAKIKGKDGQVTEQAVTFNEDDARAVRMAAALKNLDAAQLEGLLGVSAKITRYFAAINTQYNPIFGTVNLVRDVQGALFNLTATPLKGQTKAIAGDTLSALKGIYLDARAARDRKTPTSKWAQLWEEFQSEGGQTGFRDLFANSADRAKAIERELNPTAWMDSPLGKVFAADGALKVPLTVAQKKATGVFDWLSDYNLAMENAVRLASYKAGVDQGMSKQQAASVAKNLTVNFNRKGQVGQQAGALYAFFNASMQGTARLGQTLFTMEPGKPKTLRLSATGKKIVYGGVLLGVAQAVLLAASGFDDEEPPDFVRERSLIIPTGGKTYITIPMPLGLHVLPNMGRIPAEFVMGGFKDPAQHVAKVIGLLAGSFNPIGGGASLVQMLAPTAIDPLVAIAENKDWTGKPIAKTAYNKATPGHLLAKDTATYPAKVLAEAINIMSGGTEFTAGVFSPTPDQIDYLFGQATGGVGREAGKLQQTGSAMFSGEDLPIHKVPLVGRFYGDADTQSAQSGKFYSAINRLNVHEAEIKGLRKDGRGAEAAKYIQENPDSRLFVAANFAEREVQKLRAAKLALIAKDAPAEEVKAMETRINERMTRFNQTVQRLREKNAA